MADGYDTAENAHLMSSAMKRETQKPDWSRFGLSEEQQKEAETLQQPDKQDSYHHVDPAEDNELFTQDPVSLILFITHQIEEVIPHHTRLVVISYHTSKISSYTTPHKQDQ